MVRVGSCLLVVMGSFVGATGPVMHMDLIGCLHI